MAAAMTARKPVILDKVVTMADGIGNRAVSELTLAHTQAYVDEVVSVSEEEIGHALLMLLERGKAVVEPAGAVALAALLAGKVPGKGPAVALVSGGNVDPLLLTKLIHHGLSVAGRYLILRVALSDRPGELARLTSQLAAMGLNVLDVEHHRSGVLLDLDQVEVLLTLETRDPDHRHEVVESLAGAGFDVELVR
jgi:threonine dehydratase